MKIVSVANMALVSSVIAMSCGSPAGTQPHAMSAAEHEAAAAIRADDEAAAQEILRRAQSLGAATGQ